MQTDEDHNEPDKTPAPPFSRNPLELAEDLAKEYVLLSDAYEAPGGTRDQLNLHLEKSYRLGFFYYQSLPNYRLFGAHEYFRDLRQKPNEHNIMRSVLKFTMQAKRNKQRLYRLYKRAPVFEYLYAEGVIPDDVAALLKERGGVDCIYDQLCTERKLRREEFPAEDESHDANLALAENVTSGATNGANDDDNYDEWRGETGEATQMESPGVHDDGTLDGQGQRKPIEMPMAANDHSDELEEEVEPEQTKQGRLDVIDLETTVAIEMEQPHQVDLVLEATGGQIRFKVWPRDKRGWRRATGYIVSLDARNDDHSPDAPNDDVA